MLKDEWETPPALFAQLHAEFGFTLDACAQPENAKCARYFSPIDDGLCQEWGREVVWCNPPFGRGEIARWLRKAARAARAGATVVCLVPADTSTSWWHDDLQPVATEVRFLRGRVKFLRGGRAGWRPQFGCALAVFRATLALERAS